MKSSVSKFNLEKRTLDFGKAIIEFCKHVERNDITRPLISQLVRSGTSVGANYCEADDAESRADFIHKIGICKKEARETTYFLHMMSVAFPPVKEDARVLWKEAKELNLIFNSIFIKTKKNSVSTGN